MPPKFRARKDLLANGLRVVTIELPHLHKAVLVTYAKVGSRYETPAQNGLSHFVEHMLFRGTAAYPSSFALNYAIEELGGTLYAETGRDYSLYQISLDPKFVPRGIAIFGELLGAPKFTDIDLERQIILEELQEDLDSRGRDVNLDDRARMAMFPGHPLAQKITGPVENVKRFTAGDIRRHFRRAYGAQNLVFCVAGPILRRAVVAHVRRALAGLAAGRPLWSKPPPPPEGGPRLLYVANPGAQTSMELLFRGLPETHPDYVGLQMLMRILDDGMSTRLHYTLCDQMGLAYYVSAQMEPFHDCALVEVSGASKHHKFPELVDSTLGILSQFREKAVAGPELAKAKRRYQCDLRAALDDADAMAGWFGGTELFYAPPTFEEKAARVEAVTADDILRVATTVLRPERMIAAASGGLTLRQRGKWRNIVRAWA